MAISKSKVFQKDGFGIGLHESSGKYCIFIPVSNSLVDYLEYYEISEADYQTFASGQEMSRLYDLVDRSKKRLNDDTLIEKPGSDRGSPG